MEVLKGKNIGIGITGSFCTIDQVLKEVENLQSYGVNIYPFLSKNASTFDTRFNTADEVLNKIKGITNNKIVTTIVEAEPVGPQRFLDAFVIIPCTGNTMAKFANGITDTSVLMAAKATLRNMKPVIIGVATNDGLGLNLKNIGVLLNSKNVYFIPFSQDNHVAKPNSLVAEMNLLPETLAYALNDQQIQPAVRGPKLVAKDN